MRVHLEVENQSSNPVSRAGEDFGPGERRKVWIPAGKVMEVKACRQLSMKRLGDSSEEDRKAEKSVQREAKRVQGELPGIREEVQAARKSRDEAVSALSAARDRLRGVQARDKETKRETALQGGSVATIEAEAPAVSREVEDLEYRLWAREIAVAESEERLRDAEMGALPAELSEVQGQLAAAEERKVAAEKEVEQARRNLSEVKSREVRAGKLHKQARTRARQLSAGGPDAA